MPMTLDQACTPRPSVFDPNLRDTVYNLDELGTVDASRFFAENYVTEGMQILLSEAFKRLEGRSENAPGAFLLSQSMGGGKTHNLIALGLLAKNPSLRSKVMSSFYTPGTLGTVRVVAFSGRTTNTPFGIWGEIAKQLNNFEALRDFYQPLRPPGDKDWVELLRGEPVLILLDELPPYFEAQRAVKVGATSPDAITTTALANLLIAMSSGNLPNACIVLTDLHGSAYGVCVCQSGVGSRASSVLQTRGFEAEFLANPAASPRPFQEFPSCASPPSIPTSPACVCFSSLSPMTA